MRHQAGDRHHDLCGRCCRGNRGPSAGDRSGDRCRRSELRRRSAQRRRRRVRRIRHRCDRGQSGAIGCRRQRDRLDRPGFRAVPPHPDGGGDGRHRRDQQEHEQTAPTGVDPGVAQRLRYPQLGQPPPRAIAEPPGANPRRIRVIGVGEIVTVPVVTVPSAVAIVTVPIVTVPIVTVPIVTVDIVTVGIVTVDVVTPPSSRSKSERVPLSPSTSSRPNRRCDRNPQPCRRPHARVRRHRHRRQSPPEIVARVGPRIGPDPGPAVPGCRIPPTHRRRRAPNHRRSKVLRTLDIAFGSGHVADLRTGAPVPSVTVPAGCTRYRREALLGDDRPIVRQCRRFHDPVAFGFGRAAGRCRRRSLRYPMPVHAVQAQPEVVRIRHPVSTRGDPDRRIGQHLIVVLRRARRQIDCGRPPVVLQQREALQRIRRGTHDTEVRSGCRPPFQYPDRCG